MKKVVAFLLAFLIFVTPMTTLVKADVVIGDNDNIIVDENATILGRKLALLESFSDLALSGVTEFTISHTTDVDSYLDYLWSELNDAIESLSDGTGFTEISNELKSKYFTNLVQYKDYITNRGTYLSQLLPSGSPTTTLLSTFFANNIFGKQTTQHYDLALDMFKSLSEFRSGPVEPTPNPDSNYESIINFINKRQSTNENNEYVYNTFWFWDRNFNSSSVRQLINFADYSWVYYQGYSSANIPSTFNASNSVWCFPTPIRDLHINSDGNGNYTFLDNPSNNTVVVSQWQNGNWLDIYYLAIRYNQYTVIDLNSSYSKSKSSSGSLNTVMNYIKDNYKNVNIYVDDVCWAYVGGNVSYNPTLDIDGFLKLYDNNQPRQYELQPNTKIDYDQLYQVIYNAIRDNLPISQGDINYYDSHDTIYSPTIINNYGEDEGDESDLIDTILDYAVIPKFDTAIAQPMRQALTNGVVIMQNSITNVIPNEILLILGACFFLLLFAVVINRMIR